MLCVSLSLYLLVWGSHLCLWHQCMEHGSALRDVCDSKDGPYDQGRSFCAFWARTVLAPWDAVGIHHHILSRSGLCDASSDHLCQESLASLFGPSVKCDLSSLEALRVPSAISVNMRTIISDYILNEFVSCICSSSKHSQWRMLSW